jgi:predicted nucleic acid-binding protein
MDHLASDAKLLFSRYTQIGLLRLLTNKAVMGEETLTVREAWEVYDRWLEDPRVHFYPEPRGVDEAFRRATEPFAENHASKWIGDCWLLSVAMGTDAKLVTFDRALQEFSQKHGQSAVIPA